MGKAFVFIGAMLVVAFMFSTMGQPGVQTSSDSTTVTWSGGTIFDYWATNAQEKTERVRLEQANETQRMAIKQAEETQRNADFWQMFPYIVLACAALAAAVGFSIVGVAWATNRPASKPGTAIQPVTNYNYYQDATYHTYQQYNAAPPQVEKWDYANGFPPLPEDKRKYITVSRK